MRIFGVGVGGNLEIFGVRVGMGLLDFGVGMGLWDFWGWWEFADFWGGWWVLKAIVPPPWGARLGKKFHSANLGFTSYLFEHICVLFEPISLMPKYSYGPLGMQFKFLTGLCVSYFFRQYQGFSLPHEYLLTLNNAAYS